MAVYVVGARMEWLEVLQEEAGGGGGKRLLKHGVDRF